MKGTIKTSSDEDKLRLFHQQNYPKRMDKESSFKYKRNISEEFWDIKEEKTIW